ncbi:hypothetical protein [uncultured Paracoccus sp.]|uniref:hypothetical protein n=1 Tax=uncultured Paracoccus sp. TaxID=189685 RepID=UPI002622C300|nr:hypothetical protein [uncultured Paracoccus sp.]
MIRFLAFAVLLAWPVAGQAAGPVDPDWPCVQRRQPQLSVAQLWSGPPVDAAIEARAKAPEIRRLAEVIALRRTSMNQAERLVEEFAQGATREDLTALFLATFGQIQTARDRVMAGITRYAHQQEALDSQIEDKRHRFQEMTEAEPQDFDAMDDLEEEIDWATRIFVDRQQALTYVCETPVILEQRAFALGRTIAAKLPRQP